MGSVLSVQRLGSSESAGGGGLGNTDWREIVLYPSFYTGVGPSPGLIPSGGRWEGGPAPSSVGRALYQERMVSYCRTTSASTAPRTPRITCCPDAYVLISVLRVSRSCELFPNGFDIYLLQLCGRYSGFLIFRRLEVDFPVVWYKSVNSGVRQLRSST